MPTHLTEAEGHEVSTKVLSGLIHEGDVVEVLAGLFTIAKIENRKGDVHVVMVQRVDTSLAEVTFRVGANP